MIGRHVAGIALALALGIAGHARAADAGDAEKGKAIFNRCKACHTFDPNGKSRIGPDLWGVIGRKAGTEPGYSYSSAMKKAGEGGLVWTPEKLDAYLTDPKQIVPNNRMTFPGLKQAQERADVIAYLGTATGK